MTRLRRGPEGDGELHGRRFLRGAGFVALALTVALVAGCTGSGDEDASATTEVVETGGTLRVGVVGIDLLAAFDPLNVAPTNPSAMIALDVVSDSLTEAPGGVGSTEPAVPSIATSLTPDSAHTVWTVVLDGDRTFSDGSPITADDVVFSLDRVKEKGASSLAGARLDVLSSIDAVDAATVRITTTGPFVELPELLASPLFGIVSKAAVAADPETTIGSGPYRLIDGGAATPGTTIGDGTEVSGPLRLERTPAPGGAHAGPDVVELHPFGDVAESYAALTAGDLDWSLAPTDATAPAPDVAVLDDVRAGVVGWFGINAADPTYGDATFRQAIARAVNRDVVVDEVEPDALPIEAVVPDGVPGSVADPCGGACDVSYSPEGARALLATAFPDGTIPTVTLNGYDDPGQKALLDQVQRDLEAVGIPVEQRLEAPDAYEAFVVSGQQGVFSLGTVGIVPIQDSYAGSSFLSDSWDNATGIRSDTLDAQIREARGTEDATKREDLYRSVETQVLAQYVQIPVYQMQVHQAVSIGVTGFETRLDGTLVLDGLTVASS